MAIKTLNGALSKFRNLKQLQTYLDEMAQGLKATDKLLKLYQRKTGVESASTNTETSANPKGFKVSLDDTAPTTVAPKGGSAKVSMGKTQLNSMLKNFGLVEDLSDKLQFLTESLSQLQYTFKGDKGYAATVKSMQDLKAQVQERLNSAYQIVSALAAQHQPDEYKQWADKITKQLVSHLKIRTSKKPTVKLLVNSVEKGNLTLFTFTKYILLTDLQTDQDYVYDRYYVILQGVVHPNGGIEYKVATSLKFMGPTQLYGLDEVDSVQDALSTIEDMMGTDGMSHILSDTPLPITEQDLDLKSMSAQEYIKSIECDDDANAIIVVLNKKVKDTNVQDVAKKLFIDIKGLLNKGKVRIKFLPRYKVAKIASGMATPKQLYQLTFTMAPPDTSNKENLVFTKDQLSYIADLWKMTPEQKRQLRKFL